MSLKADDRGFHWMCLLLLLTIRYLYRLYQMTPRDQIRYRNRWKCWKTCRLPTLPGLQGTAHWGVNITYGMICCGEFTQLQHWEPVASTLTARIKIRQRVKVSGESSSLVSCLPSSRKPGMEKVTVISDTGTGIQPPSHFGGNYTLLSSGNHFINSFCRYNSPEEKGDPGESKIR